MLKENTKAPDFLLEDQNGEKHSLKEFRGKKVVLYFYPKDNTKGCTTQACGFRDVYREIQKKGAVVIGISKDTVSSHKKFEEKYELPFLLLSNPETDVIQKYDVWKEKSMYGRKYFGIERSTYIIDETGKIIRCFEKVKPADNPKEILEALG